MAERFFVPGLIHGGCSGILYIRQCLNSPCHFFPSTSYIEEEKKAELNFAECVEFPENFQLGNSGPQPLLLNILFLFSIFLFGFFFLFFCVSSTTSYNTKREKHREREREVYTHGVQHKEEKKKESQGLANSSCDPWSISTWFKYPTHTLCVKLYTPPPPTLLALLCVSFEFCVCVCEGKPLVCPSFYTSAPFLLYIRRENFSRVRYSPL